jgi:hypothetical protein
MLDCVTFEESKVDKKRSFTRSTNWRYD